MLNGKNRNTLVTITVFYRSVPCGRHELLLVQENRLIFFLARSASDHSYFHLPNYHTTPAQGPLPAFIANLCRPPLL